MKNVLALCGGGIRIALQAEILRRVWPLRKFDLVAGTSAGGLNALCLSIGMLPIDVAEMAAKDGPGMFSRAWYRLGLGFARYDNRGRFDMCRRIFGERTMDKCQLPTMITSYNLHTRKTHMWRSWDAGAATSFMIDAAMATSAAPVYFGAWKGFIDGGVFANNPSLFALAAAKRLYGSEPITLWCIGTGMATGADNPWNEGLTGYALKIVGIILDADAGAVDDCGLDLTGAMGDRYISINPSLGRLPAAMDHTNRDHIEALRELGRTCPMPEGL